MTLEELLASVPDNWSICLDCQPKYNKAGIYKKKKFIPLKWTVYLSNGEIIATKHFVSIWVDGNDLNETLERAIATIHQAIEEKDKELNKKK